MTREGSVRCMTFPAGDGPALVVHGGAWDIPASEWASHEDGLRAALRLGADLLRDGAAAVDVVTEVVARMEAHGAFDAGRGSVLTRQGHVEMDAGIMCGRRAAYGAAALLRETVHPIRLARHLLEADRALLRFAAGPEADRMARRFGLRTEPNGWFVCGREAARHAEIARRQRDYHTSQPFHGGAMPRGTVGAVARDTQGHMAAATSTGGTPFRPEGRIGDTPLPGCGFFADHLAAASATGWGEAISASLLCGRAVMDARSPLDAARAQIQDMYDRIPAPAGAGATGGVILLTARAGGAVAWSTPRMARAAWCSEGTSFLVVD